MTEYIAHGGIKIASSLHDLVRDEIAPGTGVTPDTVWTLLDSIVRTLGPRNRALLEKRDALQAKIDAWLGERRGAALEPQATAAFLREIGYLVPVGPAFTVTTTNVDPEVATLAGPQLVVPVDNPRYALNAANARWGSLYDALYGTNVIAEDNGAEKGRGYNPVRGERVIAKANEFLDQAVPLTGAQWADVTALDAASGTPCVPLARRPQREPRRCSAVRRVATRRRCVDERAAAPSWAAHRHRDRSDASDRPTTPGRRQGRRARERAHDDHGLRRLRRHRRRRRQDRRLSQLVRHHARHAGGFGRQRQRHDRAAPQRRSAIHGTERRRRSRCPGAACCSFATSALTC